MSFVIHKFISQDLKWCVSSGALYCLFIVAVKTLSSSVCSLSLGVCVCESSIFSPTNCWYLKSTSIQANKSLLDQFKHTKQHNIRFVNWSTCRRHTDLLVFYDDLVMMISRWRIAFFQSSSASCSKHYPLAFRSHKSEFMFSYVREHFNYNNMYWLNKAMQSKQHLIALLLENTRTRTHILQAGAIPFYSIQTNLINLTSSSIGWGWHDGRKRNALLNFQDIASYGTFPCMNAYDV